MFYIPDSEIERILGEDVRLLDLTTMTSGISCCAGVAELGPKRDCVVAGVEDAARIFEKLGARTEVLAQSGDTLGDGQLCIRAEGPAGILHFGWKAAQTVMEYSSGIATRAAKMTQNARAVNPRANVAVTRKNFPGGKLLSVKAALAGGAVLHRMSMSETVLVFDQHRVFMGGFEKFLELIPKMKLRLPEKKLAVEVATAEEGIACLKAGADVIQCEKFAPEALKIFVEEAKAVKNDAEIIAAGGINADNAADYARVVDTLVTSWVYFGKPEDIRVRMKAL